MKDIVEVKPAELSKELNVTHEHALQVLRACQQDGTDENKENNFASCVRSSTALQMLQQNRSKSPILTFCSAMDKMLGGGIQLGEITEFCGVPGIGKTQLGMQVVMDVQIPTLFGGVEGEAVYIDTEGSFMVERVVEIGEALAAHLRRIANTHQNEHEKAVAEAMTIPDLLCRVHYFRVYDYVEQLAVVKHLTSFLTSHPKVRVIVMDSVSFHFRHDFEDMGLRTRLLSGLAQDLLSISKTHDCAIVLINQMTTKIDGAGSMRHTDPLTSEATNGSSYLIPALGESWSHACTNRVILYWKQAQRMAHLYKSPSLPPDTVQYQVTSGGIRDVRVAGNSTRKRERDDTQTPNATPAKMAATSTAQTPKS
eukprot:GILJ01012843.1.p1 GENE.GILJ01012843.1~~GILJ01012843.1.p1  ORF type:complete len:384 (+),score=30.15 GILJ01012843.1:54-1154(+)